MPSLAFRVHISIIITKILPRGPKAKQKFGDKHVYHAIETTANQNKENLIIVYLRYNIQPSHNVLHVCHIDCLGYCIFYDMVQNS